MIVQSFYRVGELAATPQLPIAATLPKHEVPMTIHTELRARIGNCTPKIGHKRISGEVIVKALWIGLWTGLYSILHYSSPLATKELA